MVHYWNLIMNNLLKKYIQIDKIRLDEHNRMLRIGGGLHDSKKFFRVDLWLIGYRFKLK